MSFVVVSLGCSHEPRLLVFLFTSASCLQERRRVRTPSDTPTRSTTAKKTSFNLLSDPRQVRPPSAALIGRLMWSNVLVLVSGHPGTNIGSTDSPKVSATASCSAPCEMRELAVNMLLVSVVGAVFTYTLMLNFIHDCDLPVDWESDA